ncbi:phosphopantetheine-binding protein, partial [Actinoplanes sp. NPDC051343]|uniref:phosphopantetheine-binding protein n=1 Tax=Actinoplanes sp. NPDC051343 TaxID=3363906 RepID=UPI0037B1BF6A
ARLPVGSPVEDPEFFAGQLTGTVRFADAITGLIGCTTFVEAGPDAVLLGAASECLGDVNLVPIARRGSAEVATLVGAIAELHNLGRHVDWAAFFAGAGASLIDLPTYRFGRERYWKTAPVVAAGDGPRRLATPDGGLIMTGRLGEHQAELHGVAVVPDTVLADLALAAAGAAGHPAVLSLRIEQPLDATTGQVQVTVRPSGELTIHAGDAESGWTLHATGMLDTAPSPLSVTPPGDESITDAYGELRRLGHGYGDTLRCLTDVRRGRAELVAPTQALILESLVQLAALEAGEAVRPSRWEGLVAAGPGPDGPVRVTLAGGAGSATDASGRVVLAVRELHTEPVTPDQVTATGTPPLLHLEHVPVPLGDALGDTGSGTAVVSTDGTPESAAVLEAAGRLDEPEVSLRRGIAYVPRLCRTPATAAARPDLAGETVLILGSDERLARHLRNAYQARAIEVSPAEAADALAAGPAGVVQVSGAADVVGDRELRMFVLVSSGPEPGATYDAVAERRAASGLTATSIWYPAPGTPGFGELSAGARLRLFDRAVASGRPVVTAGRIDPVTAHRVPLLRELAGPTPDHGLADRLRGLPEAERGRALLDLVRTEAAAVTGHDVDNVEAPFTELGFDSLAVIDLRTRLSAVSGLRLPSTLAFDHPTPAAVAAYLAAELDPEASGPDLVAEIDRLAALLAVSGDARRHRAVARLEAVMSGLRDSAPAPDLAAASDDELFAMLDGGL